VILRDGTALFQKNKKFDPRKTKAASTKRKPIRPKVKRAAGKAPPAPAPVFRVSGARSPAPAPVHISGQ